MAGTIGDRIREVRASHNMNLDQFGEVIGVAGSSVCRWENGTRVPGSNFAAAIAEAYGVNGHWLLTGSEFGEAA